MDNEVFAMALRMIGKNIMLIANAIYKEPEPAEVDEKPKKRTRKAAKAEPKTDTVEEETAPEEEKKPEITFQQSRSELYSHKNPVKDIRALSKTSSSISVRRSSPI